MTTSIVCVTGVTVSHLSSISVWPTALRTTRPLSDQTVHPLLNHQVLPNLVVQRQAQSTGGLGRWEPPRWAPRSVCGQRGVGAGNPVWPALCVCVC